MSIMNLIYQRAAAKLGIDEATVRDVGEHSFAWLRLRMSNLDIETDKILYTGLGTFKLMTSKMRKTLDRGRLSKEDKEKTITLLNKFDKT